MAENEIERDRERKSMGVQAKCTSCTKHGIKWQAHYTRCSQQSSALLIRDTAMNSAQSLLSNAIKSSVWQTF